jgi:hypothetical protein
MRGRVLAMAVTVALGAAATVPAGDVVLRRRHDGARPEIFLDVPLDYSTDVVFPFGGSHHAVPGVVSINRRPYRCLVHEREFRERAHFVAHLRIEHGLEDDAIPAAIIVDRGQAIFVGK